MKPREARPTQGRTIATLMGLTALAASLFLFRIGAPSLWFDEAFSVDMVRDGFDFLELDRGIEVSGMALYYTLLEPWIKFSLNEGWIRLLSAMAAIAAVPATWLLVRRLFDARIATMATLLLIVNPFTIRFAQEARSYSLLLLLAVVSTHLLVRAVQHPTWRGWIGYGLVAALIPYTQVLGSTLLLVHALGAMIHSPRPPWPRMIAAAAIVAFAMVPLAMGTAGLAEGALARVRGPSLPWIAEQLLAVGGGEVAGGPNTHLRAPVGAVALCLAVAGALVASGFVARRPRSWAAALVLAWFVVPAGLSIVGSFVRPVLVARYLIASLPALAILGALAIDAIPSPRWRGGLLVAAVAVALVGVGAYYADPGRPDWRGAASYMERRGAPGDRWLADPTWSWRPIEFYIDRDGVIATFPLRLWRDLDSSDAGGYRSALGRTAKELAQEGRAIWLVVTGSSAGTSDVLSDPRYSPFLQSYRAVETRVFDRITVFRFVPIG